MAEKKEQVKPLAPASHRQYFTDDNDAVFPLDSKKQRHRQYVQCCGCIVALMLIQAVVLLVLIFTVFRIKDPKLKMNSVRISSTNLSSLTALTNITVTADVSIKNPNVAAFKFSNVTTTTVYYGGVAVGEGRNPPGVAAARRTLRLNVTVELAVGKLLEVARLGSDLRFGELNVSTYTRVGGRVKILGLFKKNVVVKMNCTMSVNVTSQEIRDQSCWRRVSI
ncbi:hypothetical protein RHSIM_Rhsim02G0236600 [Rhododendron simsii]|uniref:Late embryogenesis abundant protein LEA-2 subgroup domain-containing protein n=1 Tax=Rhododendron simsii TaxID=118357 RepID=A0A834HN86_RHOSS|nr:hypothetical protein RHSIM_Rhsim02G0236600 [Rhododendron simsii]